MSRRLRYGFILTLVALSAFGAAAVGWRYARVSAPVNGPIVLISIDALRADHLPAYGYHAGKTPAIDALAVDGIVFERAYSHVPQTLPAHAALLTGRLPFENGVRDGVGFALSQSERLLPEMLRDRGYATGGVVSSFLLRKESGISQGFTFFDADTAEAPSGGPLLQRDGGDSERVAQRWLESAGTSRAFLFLHLAEPYQPSTSPERFAHLAPYDAGIAYADELVGRLILYLKTHQLYDQSTIVLVSDHGEGLGDHGEQGHGLLVYDEALRVPLIIKQAGGESAGLRVKSLVQQIDIVPTILDLAKAPMPSNLRGRSLTPLFRKDGSLGTRVVYSESLFGRYHFGWSGLTSVTDGRYRYVSASSEELYDLDRDPQARENLIEAQPEIAATLRKALEGFVSTPPGSQTVHVTDDDRARLEALGYVGRANPLDATVDPPPQPKDKTAVVEQYRAAVRLLADRNWTGAIAGFRALTALEPTMSDAWMHLATTASLLERHDAAVDAYNRVIGLLPASADGYLGAATALLRLRKLDQARQRAQHVVDEGLGNAGDQAVAHELLARVALGRRNVEGARAEAALAEEADATRPVVAYVNGRIALDRRHDAEALELFEPALATIATHRGRPLGDLRLYVAESLLRSDRISEAEYLFLEELKTSPLNSRALTGLIALYKASGRNDEAAATAVGLRGSSRVR